MDVCQFSKNAVLRFGRLPNFQESFAAFWALTKTKKQDARTKSRAPYLYLKDSSAIHIDVPDCEIASSVPEKIQLSEASSGIGPFA